MAWKSKNKAKQKKKISVVSLGTPVKKGPIVLPKVLELNNKLFQKHILPYVKPLEKNATQEQKKETALKLLETIYANRNDGGLAGIIYKEGTGRTIKSPNQVLKDKKADCDELAFLYIAAAQRLNLTTEDFSILEIKLNFSEGNSNHAVVLNIENEIFELTTGEVISIKGEINNERLSKAYGGKFFNKKEILSVSLISNSKGGKEIAAVYYEKLGSDLFKFRYYKKAIESFEMAYASKPTEERRKRIIQNLFSISTNLIKQEKYTSAEDHLNKILKYDKTNEKAHHDLGVCYSETGDEVKAIAEFKKATLTWDKELRKRAYYNLLSLQIKTNKLSGAEKTIKEIKQKNIETAGIHRLMGDVHRIIGRHKEAIEAYDKSLSMKKRVITYHNKALVFYNLGADEFNAGKYEKAKEHFGQALEVVNEGLDNCSPTNINYQNLKNSKEEIEKLLRAR